MTAEDALDGLEGIEGVATAGVDDGAHAGEHIGAPRGAEAVGDLAMDDAGTQVPLGAVVGGGHGGIGEEGEEVVAELAVALAQADAVRVGRLPRHDAVHAAFDVGVIAAQSGVAQLSAAPVMADLGADVIKIEPPTGDRMRGFEPKDADGVAAYYNATNAGKRVLRLDLKSSADGAVFRRLVAGADVLIESFRPGVLDRLGFPHEALRALNPRLIYTAFGPWSNSHG